jgi:hypothetical protein
MKSNNAICSSFNDRQTFIYKTTIRIVLMKYIYNELKNNFTLETIISQNKECLH